MILIQIYSTAASGHAFKGSLKCLTQFRMVSYDNTLARKLRDNENLNWIAFFSAFIRLAPISVQAQSARTAKSSPK